MTLECFLSFKRCVRSQTKQGRKLRSFDGEFIHLVLCFLFKQLCPHVSLFLKVGISVISQVSLEGIYLTNYNADRSDYFINFKYILPVLLKRGLLCKPLDVHGSPACEKCELDNVYNSHSGASTIFVNGLLRFDVNHINIFVSKMMRIRK